MLHNPNIFSMNELIKSPNLYKCHICPGRYNLVTYLRTNGIMSISDEYVSDLVSICEKCLPNSKELYLKMVKNVKSNSESEPFLRACMDNLERLLEISHNILEMLIEYKKVAIH